MYPLFIRLSLLFFFLTGLVHAADLSVYERASDESREIGTLIYADWISEQPVPPQKVKKITYEKNAKGKRVKQERWVEVQSKNPPEYVPVTCKFGSGFVRRGDLARFQQEAAELSGVYESETGRVWLQKSPNSPGKFSLVISNGNGADLAEFEAGNLEMKKRKNRDVLLFSEPGCRIMVEIQNRVLTVSTKGCEEYKGKTATLDDQYGVYKPGTRRAETFDMPEVKLFFSSFLWCPEGPESCEKNKGDDGDGAEIIWSADGKGMVHKISDGSTHIYRPYERVIPRKQDFFKGEKPVILKTKRTDMASEWMLWYYYPDARRFKMVRAGTRPDVAYTEIFEK
jgi:hypothetical protein